MRNHNSIQDQQSPEPFSHDEQPGSFKPSPRIPFGIVVALSAVVVFTGSATAWWTWTTVTSKTQPPTSSAPASVESPNPQVDGSSQGPVTQADGVEAPQPEPSSVAQEEIAQVYWLDVNGNQIELVPQPVQPLPGENPEESLETAFQSLLKGPDSSATTFSEIPSETQVHSVTLEDDGVHIDLSQGFTVGGGSASMMGRLGQIVYTATSLEPSTNVWISVDGEPLEVLGGEGLIVEQPMTRESFAANFPL